MIDSIEYSFWRLAWFLISQKIVPAPNPCYTNIMSKTTPNNAAAMPQFEQSIEEIEKIITGIESGQVSLAGSLDQYARGMKLIQHCRQTLDGAEKRIKQLTVTDDGQVVESDQNDISDPMDGE